jgi:AmpE protein|tara:strand:+ start:4369 stop:5319 length:951 start_codon:yes stop_codon:yes gene_type:complete
VHFLIILIAIAVLESNGQLAFIQRDLWVQKWHRALAKLPALKNSGLLKVAVYVLVPVIALQLVLWYLGSGGNGILVFLLELGVLLYCLGRGDLSAQIAVLESDIQRSDLQAAFHDAAVFNIGHRAVSADSAEGLFRELAATLPYRLFERSFVVVFWFFFLGAPLALAYRLLALHGDMQLGETEVLLDEDQAGDEDIAEALEAAVPNQANKLLWYLEWIPVRFLALTLGLMGDFSQAISPLKELVFCPKTSTADVLRLCVLGALNRQSSGVSQEVSQEPDVASSDTVALAQVGEIVALFRRSMTGWLVVIALLVLTS